MDDQAVLEAEGHLGSQAHLAEDQWGEDLVAEYHSELVHSGWRGAFLVEMGQGTRKMGLCSVGMAWGYSASKMMTTLDFGDLTHGVAKDRLVLNRPQLEAQNHWWEGCGVVLAATTSRVGSQRKEREKRCPGTGRQQEIDYGYGG